MPTGPLIQLSVGRYHSCALQPNAMLTCWGGNTYGEATVPVGEYSQASAGAYHTCAVTTDQSAVCWGYNTRGQSAAPTGAFAQVSVGESFRVASPWREPSLVGEATPGTRARPRRAASPRFPPARITGAESGPTTPCLLGRRYVWESNSTCRHVHASLGR